MQVLCSLKGELAAQQPKKCVYIVTGILALGVHLPRTWIYMLMPQLYVLQILTPSFQQCGEVSSQIEFYQSDASGGAVLVQASKPLARVVLKFGISFFQANNTEECVLILLAD